MFPEAFSKQMEDSNQNVERAWDSRIPRVTEPGFTSAGLRLARKGPIPDNYTLCKSVIKPRT